VGGPDSAGLASLNFGGWSAEERAGAAIREKRPTVGGRLGWRRFRQMSMSARAVVWHEVSRGVRDWRQSPRRLDI
ncbi:MAG: hypothetical protein ACKV22_18450, partial [Bryobacteraceae bacterium]